MNISYSPDVFGGTRRSIESLAAQADSQRFQLEATYLTLTSNLAGAAVQEASLRGQIAATQSIIKIETDVLDLLRRQRELGQVAEADVVAQEAALAQVEQTLPPLQKQLAQQRDLLAALSGGFPERSVAPAIRSRRRCGCRATCRSVCPRSWWSSARTCVPPRQICTPPAP